MTDGVKNGRTLVEHRHDALRERVEKRPQTLVGVHESKGHR